MNQPPYLIHNTAVNVPKVSIICPTYNHEGFIRTAIDSFLNQKTIFDYEIIVRDDASTDQTTRLLKEIQKNNPSKITLIIHTENQFSKGKNSVPELLRYARGDYVAFCEGDDYWCDPLKLQTQVAEIESNSCITASCHLTYVQRGSNNIEPDDNLFVSHNKSFLMSLKDVAVPDTPFHTTSFIARNSSLHLAKNPIFFGKSMSGDIMLYCLAASHGKISYIHKLMSVYRIHDNGITKSKDQKNKVKFYLNRLYIWTILNQSLSLPWELLFNLYKFNLSELRIAIKETVASGNALVLIACLKYSLWLLSDVILYTPIRYCLRFRNFRLKSQQ